MPTPGLVLMKLDGKVRAVRFPVSAPVTAKIIRHSRFSIRDLAYEMEMSPNAIRKITQGHARFSKSALVKLADILSPQCVLEIIAAYEKELNLTAEELAKISDGATLIGQKIAATKPRAQWERQRKAK